MFYVNHKCVPVDDPTATHFKAKSIFIDDIGLPLSNVFTLLDDKSTKGHDTEANVYEQRMRDMKSLPVGGGFPVIDMIVLGMGIDGHIGSLYAGRKEVMNTEKWVLSVDKKSPSSITLSLPVINNAKDIRVVLMGADKAEAALIGVTKRKTASDFPVCGIVSDSKTTWMIDEPCASLLKSSGIAVVSEV